MEQGVYSDSGFEFCLPELDTFIVRTRKLMIRPLISATLLWVGMTGHLTSLNFSRVRDSSISNFTNFTTWAIGIIDTFFMLSEASLITRVLRCVLQQVGDKERTPSIGAGDKCRFIWPTFALTRMLC
jgi:hypothetical protein